MLAFFALMYKRLFLTASFSAAMAITFSAGILVISCELKIL